MEPGEIYLADLVEAGRRPVLVVSRESLNRGNYVTIVYFTTGRLEQRKALRNCVFFSAGTFGLTADCVAQCETISTVSIFDLEMTSGPLGKLDSESMSRVIQAVGYVVDADCAPAY